MYDGSFRLDKVYEQALKDLADDRVKAIAAILFVGNLLYGSPSEGIKEAIQDDRSALGQAISLYLNGDGKLSKINGILSDMQLADGYSDFCKLLIKTNQPEKKGFFASLFQRKK